MGVIETYTVRAEGVGRKDYSKMSEFSVEPTIRSYQSLYSHCELITVPANSDTVVDIEIPLDQVVMVYDFMASIPSNNLVRMNVTAVDPVGATLTIFDKAAYQTVEKHIAKGIQFFHIIRMTLYNYRDVDETFMRISCNGLYTSSTEYFLRIPE